MGIENMGATTTSPQKPNGIEQVYADLEQIGFHDEMLEVRMREAISPQSRRPASLPATNQPAPPKP